MLPQRLIAMLWDDLYADEAYWGAPVAGPAVGPFRAVAAEVFVPGARAAAVHSAGAVAAETFIPGAKATEVS